MISAHEMLPACVARWSIPVDQLAHFAQLPSAVRAEVQDLLDLFNQVEADPRGVVVALQAAAADSTKRGRSFGALKNKYYALRASGWVALVNGTKARPTTAAGALPDAFIQHWQGLVQQNQRKAKPAYRELERAWARGDFIPGFGTWRDHWRKTRDDLPPSDPRFVPPLPAGWSYANLMRHGLTKFEATVARKGLAAARAYAPKVLTTRAGLSVGEYYVFDDMWHDHKVNVLGWSNTAVRPLELGCQDLASASRFAWGIRPILTRADGTEDRIKEAEMRMFVAHILCGTGYRAAGTTLMVEHGTAAIREELERQIHDLTGGAVKVERSGMDGRRQLLFEGRGRGNPNFKATLESMHNLIHNEFANLQGQIGMNRDHAPEQMHGMEKRNDLLLRAMAALPPEFAVQLQTPFLTFGQFRAIAERVYDLIDSRRDHELEGWAEAGYLTQEIRLADNLPWMDARALAGMPAAQRAAVEAVASLPGNTRAIKLSPREVFGRSAPGLVRLNPALIPTLLGDIGKREVRVGHDNMITFRDQAMGPSEFTFDTALTDADLHTSRLRAGETFLAYFSPFADQMLTLCDAKGRYLGTVKRINRVVRSDMEALHAEMGRAQHAFKELVAPVAARGAKRLQHEISVVRKNAAVLAAATQHERPADMRSAATLTPAAVDALCEADAPALPGPREDEGPGFDDIADLLS